MSYDHAVIAVGRVLLHRFGPQASRLALSCVEIGVTMHDPMAVRVSLDLLRAIEAVAETPSRVLT